MSLNTTSENTTSTRNHYYSGLLSCYSYICSVNNDDYTYPLILFYIDRMSSSKQASCHRIKAPRSYSQQGTKFHLSILQTKQTSKSKKVQDTSKKAADDAPTSTSEISVAATDETVEQADDGLKGGDSSHAVEEARSTTCELTDEGLDVGYT